MGEMLSIILITLLIFFILGIISGALAIYFLRKKKYPVLTVALAILCWLGVCVPCKFIVGFMTARVVMVLFGVFVIYVIVRVVKDGKQGA